MSTTIDSVVEVFNTETQEWEAEFGNLVKNPDYKGDDIRPWLSPYDSAFVLKRMIQEGHSPTKEESYGGKYGIGVSHCSFAVLANVCNWDGGPKPIAKPRGLPQDVSQQAQVLAKQEGEDGHSHSYVTLQELQSYNWDVLISQSHRDERTIPLREADGIPRLLKVMKRMAKLGEADKVRLVFWFDC